MQHLKQGKIIISFVLCIALLFTYAGAALAVGMPSSYVDHQESVEVLPYDGITAQAGTFELFNEPAGSDAILSDGITYRNRYLGDSHRAEALDDSWSSPVLLGTLPSSYDLRTEGKVTSVKNQGNYGTCWAHGVVAAAESNLLMQNLGTQDLSELQLVNYTYKRNALCASTGGGTAGDIVTHVPTDLNNNIMNYGGNTENALTALNNWLGLIPESELVYGNNNNISAVLDGTLDNSYAYSKDTFHLDHSYYVNIGTDASMVKSLLMTHGAASVSYHSTSSGYNAAHHSFFQNEYSGTNHAVTLCGWDDNFSSSYFNVNPGVNGAWLIKNSWGSNWYYGDSGYFWISYADPSLSGAYFIGMTSADDYDHLYQYDGGIYNGYYYYGGNSTIWNSNIFTSARDEDISAVRICLLDANTTVTVKVYTGVTNNPTGGTLQNSATTIQSCPYEGYYTIELNDAISVASGTKFSIVVEQSKSAGNALAVYDYPYNAGDKRSAVVASAGQSYISPDGSGWDDISSRGANLRIKALTTDTAIPTSIRGDVNYDSSLSVTDAVLIMRYLAGYSTFNSTKRTHADVNNDGKINVSDVLYACKAISGTYMPAVIQ